MLIKQPAQPAKPQLHTRKNHDTYNGALHRPRRTHVRIDRRGADDTRYATITLYYAHNRACTIYRSHDDVLALRQGMADAGAAAAAHPPWRPPAAAAAAAAAAKHHHSNSNSTPSTPAPCVHSCSCVCACAAQAPDARAAMELNQLLEEVLGEDREGKEAGGSAVRVPMEWFLRRRIEDCEAR